jgi:nitrogen regulatory protein PII
MPELVILVTTKCEAIDEILKAWLECGISGATTFESHGLGHHIAMIEASDDLPLMPSLASLIRKEEEAQCTVFVVVPDGFDIERLVAAVERVVGRLDDPHTGIMFTVPVSRTWGLRRMDRR